MSGGEPHEITARTRYCAVYGHPIKHSASPPMQNSGIQQLGLPWRYLAFDVHPDRLATAIQGAKAMRFLGLNLTVPHKLLALEMVDALDASAREWGAVNTIVFEGRVAGGPWKPLGQFDADAEIDVRSHGYNTDADAIVRAITEAFPGATLEGGSVLLLGAGGAAKAAALRLAQERPSALYLVNRTLEKVRELAGEIRRRHPDVVVQTDYPANPVDLLVNGTSLGLHPGDALPLDEARFPLGRAKRVYDMIYRPDETRLLAAARAAGCQVSNGLGMLLYQGARALELWSGQPAPLEAMREALHRAVRPVNRP